MKRLIVVVLIVLGAAMPVQAQGPIWLPLVEKNAMPTCERPWAIIIPEESTNLVLNPSAETTGNYSAAAGTTVTLSSTYAKFGLYSYRVQTDASNEGVNITTATLANAAHYASLYVRGDLPTTWLWSIGGENRSPQLLEQIDDNWALYGAQFSASACSAATTFSVLQSGAGAGDFYLDGVQVEELTYPTTYIDGDQTGCYWNGALHASTSTRSAQARNGGRVRDLWLDYGFFVEEVIGAGAANQTISSHDYALLPGGRLSGLKIESRAFSLVGQFVADTEHELHANRQALIKALSSDTYVEQQAARLRYGGAVVHKEIDAYYQGGLEAQLKTSYGPWQVEGEESWRLVSRWHERASLQFFTPDPMWYEIGDSAQLLDTNDSATFRYVAGRLKSTGQWDTMGAPTVGATPAAAIATAEDATYVYFGGNFTNFDGDANADHIARWNKQTETWSALGSGMNNVVWDLVIAPDGTLYAGGEFTTAGGGAANYIAAWDGAAWSALGAGMDDTVYGLAVGLDGTLYAGGDFHTAGGGAAMHIAQWSGAAWSAVGAGLNASCGNFAVGPDGTIYAGGSFTDVDGGGGGTYNYVIAWDGSSYSALGTGMNDTVVSLAMGANGILYASGHFTTAGGETANRIAQWNGTAWSPLGSGMNAIAYGELSIGVDNTLYAAGAFTTAGGIDVYYIARWNGATWAHVDIAPPLIEVYGMLASQYADPIVNGKYDVYIGFNGTGTGYYAGLVSPDNEGSQPAYPIIYVARSGGTSATLKTLRNETTGAELLFDYDLLDGEVLTINLTPDAKSITSNYFGSRPDAILANSDFGSWSLLPGDNDVSCFVDVSGTPSVLAYMAWRDTYKSFD